MSGFQETDKRIENKALYFKLYTPYYVQRRWL